MFLLVIGIEPILLKESNFKSDVSTNFTKRVLKMPQFDILTLSSQIFGLLVSLYCYYYYNITNIILYFAEIKKYRTKKLVKNNLIIRNTEK